MDNISWEKFKKTIVSKFPEAADSLNKGASEEEIAAAENKMGVTFPPQLKALYMSNNGENDERLCGIFMGLHFCTLDEVYEQWKSWKEIYDSDYCSDPVSFDRFQRSDPDGHIKKQYINLKWIPICDDAAGNHIGIDLDPDVLGRQGQVINFGRDEENKKVIAEDLGAFFERLCRITESSHFTIDEYDGENVIVLNTPNDEYDHFGDYLQSEEAVK